MRTALATRDVNTIAVFSASVRAWGISRFIGLQRSEIVSGEHEKCVVFYIIYRSNLFMFG